MREKVIIITGSSSGIGLEAAEFLGKSGHRVYGLSRKVSQSTHFQSIAADITNKMQVDLAIKKIAHEAGRIDALINNAGRGMIGAMEDAAAEEISELVQLNLIGAVQTMQAVLPMMRNQKSGKIINISSIGSEMGLPFRGFYSASKAALDKVTEAARYEVAPWNIQICALHLGDIKTNIAQSRIKSTVSEPYRKTFNTVSALMDSHVDSGADAVEVAKYIENLLRKDQLKAHYYFGKFGQKIGVPLKWLLPQNLYENLMKKYNKIS